MKKKLIVDSSVIIALLKLDLLDLLADYDVVIPEGVFEEVAVKEEVRDLTSSFNVKSAENTELLERLEERLGKGESEVIVLAVEEQSTAVLDDQTARKMARELEVKVEGTLGLLIRAKRQDKIRELKPLLDTLVEKDFRISKKLYNKALALVNER